MPYYTITTDFTPYTKVSSAELDVEFAAIKAGFDKLPSEDRMNSGNTNFVTAGGTADALTITSPGTAITTYTGQDGLTFSVKTPLANTVAPTVNVDGVGVVSLVASDGSDPVAGALSVNGIYTIVYNETTGKFVFTDEASAGLSATAAAASAVEAAADAAAAEAWAITPEDTLVPASAGGNEVDEYSALHHRAKAAIENGIDDSQKSLTTTYSSVKISERLLTNAANIALNSFDIAVDGGLSVENMVDGVRDVFTDETGIDTGRSIDEKYETGLYRNAVNGVDYPPANSTTYVKATTNSATNYLPHFCTDSALSKTGDRQNNSWQSSSGNNSNQRLHIDVGAAATLESISYNNAHDFGGSTDVGAKNFTLWGSNNAAAFAELTYGTDTNWTAITTSITQFAQHTASDVADTQTFTATVATAYRYYAVKISDNWGDANLLGLRHIELTTNNPINIALHTKSVTALASPDEAFVVVHQEDVDAVTLNTDLTAWVTRTALSTYTTLAATDNKIRVTAHGHSDDDRVIVSTATGAGFATGLSGLIAYHVINATTNDFEVSLTSGGAAVSITADSGTTQHVADYSQVTLVEATSLDTGRILTGDADLTSQATGTDMQTVLLTDNLVEMKFHALSTQWS